MQRIFCDIPSYLCQVRFLNQLLELESLRRILTWVKTKVFEKRKVIEELSILCQLDLS